MADGPTHTNNNFDETTTATRGATSTAGSTSEQQQQQKQQQQQQQHQHNQAEPSTALSTSHPLHHIWVLWYDNPGAVGKRVAHDRWFSGMKKIATFSTVEEFWGIFNNIRPPNRLTAGSNYHLFKKGIQPMWEDTSNEQGGKWSFLIPKRNKDAVNELWLTLIMAMIGENFDDGEEICGAVASARKQQDKVAVWTRRWNDDRSCMSIGTQMKQFLELTPSEPLSYVAHSDAIKQKSSMAKNRYEI